MATAADAAKAGRRVVRSHRARQRRSLDQVLLPGFGDASEDEPGVEAAGGVADISIDVDLRVSVTEVANGALPDVVGFACDGWFLLTGLQRLPHQRSTPCLQAVLPFSARSFLAPGDPVPIRVMTQHFECPDPQGGM